ncbi:lipopolysaccharide heptosyltransferase I [Sulfurimonas sp.]|uniref:lipopolysaccharide heptosyltransferase I n=1 Tax=Sulfurimonas sp. TaxID=2022749 RepID=UPI003567EB65
MKIAIVRLSAMGDIIHSAVVLQFIKKIYPESQVDWIVEKSMSAVLKDNNDIHSIIEVELKKFKKTKKLSDLLKQIKIIKSLPKYDYIIDMQGLLKSALITKFMKGEVYGFDKDSIRESIASYFYKHKIHMPYDANTIDRNVQVVSKSLDLGITSEDIHKKTPFLFYKNENKIIYDYLSKEKKNIIFVIGSTWPSRNYPKEKFVEIANELKENILVIWGSEQEKQDGEYIEQNSEFATLVPRTDLNTLKALIAQCDLLIGNDTGPTHMAWAMNIPSITIFGPTPISRVYVTDINKVVKSSSEVNPYKLNKEDFSIKEIEVKEICGIAKELL